MRGLPSTAGWIGRKFWVLRPGRNPKSQDRVGASFFKIHPRFFALLVTPAALGLVSWGALQIPNPFGDAAVWWLAGLTVFVSFLLVLSERARWRLKREAASAARHIEEAAAEDRAIHRRNEAALQESQERYDLLVQASEGGFWDWDLKKNEIRFSERWKALLGFSKDELSNRSSEWFSRVHPEDAARLRADLLDYLRGRTPGFEFEHRVRHRDGNYRWMLSRGVAVRCDRARPERLVGCHIDITRYREAEKRLLRAAMHDPLTGLPNRTCFMERLAVAGRHAHKHSDYLFALLFLDVDRFKVINDSLGHLVGDELLVSIGQRLQACVRPNDTIARLGGDEFAILLDDLREDLEATQIAATIQKELARPFMSRAKKCSPPSASALRSTRSDISGRKISCGTPTPPCRARKSMAKPATQGSIKG